jgi:hypothetical protein
MWGVSGTFKYEIMMRVNLSFEQLPTLKFNIFPLYSLLYGSVSSSDCIELNCRMTVNNELEGMQKEAAAAQYEALFQYFPGETEESQLHTIYDSWCPSRD